MLRQEQIDSYLPATQRAHLLFNRRLVRAAIQELLEGLRAQFAGHITSGGSHARKLERLGCYCSCWFLLVCTNQLTVNQTDRTPNQLKSRFYSGSTVLERLAL